MTRSAAPLKAFIKRYLFDGEILKLMSLAVMSKPIGLATQMVIASVFGAGEGYDAYILSYFLVNFVSNILGRVFAAVAIPFFFEVEGRMSKRDFDRFVNAVLVLFLLPMVLFVAVLFAAPGVVAGIGAPGAPEDTRDLTIAMLRIMALPGLLLALTEVMRSVFNLRHVFRIAAAMPIVNSVAMLVVLVLMHNQRGIWALPIAFGISYVLQAAVVVGYALARRVVVPVRPLFDRELLPRLWGRSWLVLVSVVILVLNTFLDKFFASGLPAGSISSIAYARALEGFGMQVFALSLVNVMYTRTSQYVASGRYQECDVYIFSNLKRLVRFSVPVCLSVAVASGEVVRVLFQRNAFTADDSVRTAGVLALYMVGLPAFLANNVVANVFHSLGRFRDKLWLSVQFLGSNLIGNLILVRLLQVQGLALSSTISINLHLGLSLIVLRRYRVGISGGRYAATIVAHYIVGAVAWLGYEAVAGSLFHRSAEVLGRGEAVAVGAARGAMFIAAYILVGTAAHRAFGGRRVLGRSTGI